MAGQKDSYGRPSGANEEPDTQGQSSGTVAVPRALIFSQRAGWGENKITDPEDPRGSWEA